MGANGKPTASDIAQAEFRKRMAEIHARPQLDREEYPPEQRGDSWEPPANLTEESGSKTDAPQTIRTVEPYTAFPVSELPAPFSAFVVQTAAALGCDPAFVALPGLSALASAIGNTRTIMLKRGWYEPSVVWTAIIGDSGTLKSPAFHRTVGPLFTHQKALIEEHKRAMVRYEHEVAECQEAKRKDRRGTAEDHPVRPPMRRVVCSDTTIEKLAEIQEDNPRGVLMARDELAGWLASFTRYKGRCGGSDLPNWLEMFRAGTVVVDRKTALKPTLFIQRCAVSVAGGIQPGSLARALNPEFLDAGLGARLLMAQPAKTPKRWTELEVDPNTEQEYAGLIDSLLTLDFDQRDGESVPHALTLSADGKAAWVAFYDEWAHEQAATEGELAAVYSKLEGYAARLALIHHVVTHVGLASDDRRPIGRRSVEAGIALCRWFAYEARRIYVTLSETTEQRDTRRLVDFIHGRGGVMTPRDLHRANNRRYPSTDHAEAALESLHLAGFGTWHERPSTQRGGRPSLVFTLQCTLHDKTDKTPAHGSSNGNHGPTAAPDKT
jgi:hypothetical protein